MIIHSLFKTSPLKKSDPPSPQKRSTSKPTKKPRFQVTCYNNTGGNHAIIKTLSPHQKEVKRGKHRHPHQKTDTANTERLGKTHRPKHKKHRNNRNGQRKST